MFEFKNGLNKEKKYFGEGTPIVNYTDVYKNRFLTNQLIKGKVTLTESEIERFNVKRGDVFFTRTSETQEEVGNFIVPDKNGVITLDEIPDPDFELQTERQDYCTISLLQRQPAGIRF